MWATLGWLVAVGLLALAATQVVGVGASRLLAVLHALTPHLLVLSVPLGVVAAATGHWPLALASLPSAAVLGRLSWPLLAPRPQPAADDAAAEPLRVFHGNVLYDNDRAAEAGAAILDEDADVVVVTEYSPEVAEILLTSPLAGKYPHKMGEPAAYAWGTAIWSKLELAQVATPTIATENATLVADVLTDRGWTVRIAAVHPPSPLHHFRNWVRDLVTLRQFETNDVATVMIGDFNASWWHPSMRRLMSGRFRSVHHLLRKGFSASWPNHVPAPRFVRLDHALITGDLVADDVTDITIPGSDHRGLTVTVRPATTTSTPAR